MIELSDEIETRLATAIEDGKAVVAAYVDREGKPHVSPYGSTHVHNPDELAIWLRNPESELLKTLPTRPHVSFWYGDISTRFYLTLEGRARVEEDPRQRQRIYDEMHEIERRFEPDMKGVGVVIALDRVTILTKAGKDISER